ncbi:serine/threonine-protein kinase [Streptomyces sp. JJ36]|uniref:serine/threonine-protein kinase n=1 Tax=Streptomyces sp. JJ36 TaxID=2736645 RepID=UPI0027E40B79|nr:serine/threonine-protein kinase [Streptomyces sp. JJ36]
MQKRTIGDRYELIEEISSGGMGTVWRGYDAVLDRPVAVKRIRPDAVQTPEVAEEFAKRFRREARVTARIGHHGVPEVYDAVLDSSFEQLYLVMELVRGASLRTFVNPARPLPFAWAAAIAAQVCTVLSHAHAVPVVHRDLKPDNVLVCADGAVKVLDFGVAAILRTDVTRITATGNPVGTSQYMSPEQVQAVQITPQSDLYALGCVLHELLCGQPVFSGKNGFQLMRQHVYEPPARLSDLRPDVPEALERLTLDLLAKAPEQRPADAYEVYERLLPFLPPPGSEPPAAERAPADAPDPTLLYRRPNAPRPRPGTPPTAVEPATAGLAPTLPETAPETALRDALRDAYARSRALMEDERFAQAAEVLQDVVTPAAEALGAESPRVLKLRRRRAAVLVIGGDFRTALPEFDALASAYRRTAGPGSKDALECLRQAAHCRAELGQVTAALGQFRAVLDQVTASEGDASETALDLRHNIGILLLSEGKATEAAAVLRPLHQDLCVVHGPRDETAQEVAAILTRLRMAGDADG